MRVVTDGPVVVCSIVPDTPKHDRDAEHDRDTKHEAGVDKVQQTANPEKDNNFKLKNPSSSSLAQKRTLSPPSPRETLQILETPGDTAKPTEVKDLRNPTIRLFREQPAARILPVSAPQSQSIAETRTPHGAANQPSVTTLLKTLPSSIRNRADSLTDLQPLPYRWHFPTHERYRIKDHEAFRALRQKNVEFYVTTGLLVEDYQGLRWAAGNFDYLLFWYEDGMPTPDGVHEEEKQLSFGPEFVRDCQKERWQEHMRNTAVVERPATPIVESPDPAEDDFVPLSRWSSAPLSPSCERGLPPRSRSALRQRREGSALETLFPLPESARRVKLDKRRRQRRIKPKVDEAGAAVEEEGRIVERRLEWTDSLSDNEGRTARNWFGTN